MAYGNYHPIMTLKLDRVRHSENATICNISIVYFSSRNQQMMSGILRQNLRAHWLAALLIVLFARLNLVQVVMGALSINLTGLPDIKSMHSSETQCGSLESWAWPSSLSKPYVQGHIGPVEVSQPRKTPSPPPID